MDTVSKEVRSRNMAAIREKDTKPELVVRKLLHSLGYRFRLHRKDLAGKPDVFLKKYNAAILVHGCFWHQHRDCRFAVVPKSNISFWSEKLKKNVHRDEKNLMIMNEQGIRVKVIWECETHDAMSLANVLKDFLENDGKK